METVKWREFRENMADFIARVRSGERITLTRHGKVVAEICPPTCTPFHNRPKQELDSNRLVIG